MHSDCLSALSSQETQLCAGGVAVFKGKVLLANHSPPWTNPGTCKNAYFGVHLRRLRHQHSTESTCNHKSTFTVAQSANVH